MSFLETEETECSSQGHACDENVLSDDALLSDEEEASCGDAWEPEEQDYRASGQLLSLIKSGAKAKYPTHEETKILFEKYRKGDMNARNELVERNIALVISVAKAYFNMGIEPEDLIQEGTLGLMRAIQMFDPDKGFHFSTYAVWWVRQAISRYIAQYGKTIRIPVNLDASIKAVHRARSKFINERMRDPSVEELMEITGVSEERVRFALSNENVVSLDIIVSKEDNETSLGDLIEDASVVSPEAAAVKEDLKRLVHDGLNHLYPKERYVVERRYGIGRPCERTLEEVGFQLGITRERARQLEKNATRKLLFFMRRRNGRDFLT